MVYLYESIAYIIWCKLTVSILILSFFIMTEPELPKYVYIPFYHKLKISKWENKEFMVRLLIADRIFEDMCN